MDASLSIAKNEYDKHNYQQAKYIIVNLLEKYSNYQHKDKLYYKLGAINMKLKQYDNAVDNYQQSLKFNETNLNTLFKLGKLLHYHINDYTLAEYIYKKCLELNDEHVSCMFNLGKLMVVINKFPKAEELFTKCLKIDHKKASVHYYLAISLSKQPMINNENIIIYHFQTAINLEPSVAKYCIAFGIYLEKLGKYHLANYSYSKSIKLLKHPDVSFLEKYAYFKINFMKDYKNGLKYLKIASQYNDELKYDYDNLYEYCLEINQHKSSIIKFMVFDFDSTILYREAGHMLGDLNTSDLISYFGGSDRIMKLKQLLRKNIYKDIENIIISKFRMSDIIYKTLQLLGFMTFIKRIIGANDIPRSTICDHDVIYEIIKIKDDYNVNNYNEILYISSNYNDIQNVSTECKRYFVDPKKSYPLSGINLHDFDQLSSIRDNKQYILGINANEEFKHDESISSLSKLNESLLKKLTIEVINNVKYNKSINSLPIVQDLLDSNPEYVKFIKYYENLRIAITHFERGDWWSAGQYLQRILQIEQSESGIWGRYAKCCSYLKHSTEADIAYAIALKINPRCYHIKVSYAYHLLMCGCYKASNEQFIAAMNVSKYQEMNASVAVGLARTSEELGEFDKAENYYKYAVNDSMKKYYEPAHFYYSCYLEKRGQLFESMQHINKCIKKSPHKVQNILKMCDILSKLNDREMLEHFIKIGIKIDPSVIYNYERYYKKPQYLYDFPDSKYIANAEGIVVSDIVHDAKFDEFWFDHVNISTREFNQYYDKFMVNNLNNIDLLLNDKEISEKLIKIVGINDPIHFSIILSKIKEKRIIVKGL